MRIRHIADRDWDAVVALEAGVYSDDGLSEGRAALKSRADASPGTCFVLEQGYRTAGYLLSLPYPTFRYPELGRTEETVLSSRNLHLHDLVIAEELRGRGLAKALLHHFTGTARSQGYEEISLVAVSGSDTFWAANGYRAHREVAPPSGYGPDAVYMSRPVPGARAGSKNPVHAPSHRTPMEDEVG
ncbi:GNAT family N-acetyltransferase [Streptomyces sp. NPDC048295]|uniref:GNAT family N-acetyltransferase n=1 Tax=Streptomyces sp. NPDC048295 TaxID=3154617 RepID=UPI003432F1F6